MVLNWYVSHAVGVSKPPYRFGIVPGLSIDMIALLGRGIGQCGLMRHGLINNWRWPRLSIRTGFIIAAKGCHNRS